MKYGAKEGKDPLVFLQEGIGGDVERGSRRE